MKAAPILRTRVLPAVAGLAVAGALAAGTWYAYQALAARPIERIVFRGDTGRIPPDALEALAQSLRGLPAGSVSLDAVREAARRVPWVREAAVRRRFPDALEIVFQAHEPLARWGDAALVSTHGDVFAAKTDAALPRFRGPEGSAARMAAEYPALARGLAPLGSALAELHLSARGAWQVVLASGLSLELGRGDIGARVERFARAWPGLLAAGVATAHADLRYDNGFALRRAADSPAPPSNANKSAKPPRRAARP